MKENNKNWEDKGMRKSKIINAIATFVIAFAVMMLVPAVAKAGTPNTWHQDSSTGNWYYYDETGDYVTGLQTIDDEYYYFDNNGVMLANSWKEVYTNEWMYFASNGKAVKEKWVSFNGKWCYLRDNGMMVRDNYWNIGGDYYAFDTNGYMITNNWFERSGDWLFCKEDGKVAEEEFLFINGYWYYFNEPFMIKDRCFSVEVKDDDNYTYYATYKFDALGRMETNKWYQDEYGDWMYFKQDGRAAYYEFIYSNGYWYYFDYLYMVKDRIIYIEEDDSWISDAYKFDASGHMLTNKWYQDENGDWMYFKQNGKAARDEVIKIGNAYYGFDYQEMITDSTDQYVFGGEDYYRFGSDGKAIIGWYKKGYSDGTYSWYYYGKDGKAAKEWFSENGKWYYAADGYVYCDGEYTIDHFKYRFNKDCSMVTGWYKYQYGEGKDDYRWYYYMENGHAQNGWFSENGKWYYASNGLVYCNDFYRIKGALYYFNENCSMVTGWYTRVNKNTASVYNETTGKYDEIEYETVPSYFYFGKDGKAANGWISMSGKTYYFKDGYAYSNGIVVVDNKYYVFNTDASLSKGGWTSSKNIYFDDSEMKVKTDIKWKYANSNGTAYDGWFTNKNKWYYASNGKVYSDGEYRIDNYYYRFNEDYSMVTGWYTCENKCVASVYNDKTGKYEEIEYDGVPSYSYYLSDGRGANGWLTISGKKYYFNNADAYSNGISIINNVNYVFNTDGSLASGWTTEKYIYFDYEEKKPVAEYTWTYANSNGTAYDGWLTSSGRKYYFDSGYMAKDTLYYLINDVYYAFDENGVLADGWVKITDYYDDCDDAYCVNGKVYTGWVKTNNNWYYVDESRMYKDGIYNIDGKKYAFTAGGSLITNGFYERKLYDSTWDSELGEYVDVYIGSNWYYADANGVFVTGWKQIKGNWYYFDEHEYYAYKGSHYIDVEQYWFNDDCVWVKNGWCKLTVHEDVDKDGHWYCVFNTKYSYVINGYAVVNEMIDVGGHLYCFDYNGYMLTDCTEYTYYKDEYVKAQIGSNGVVTSWEKA